MATSGEDAVTLVNLRSNDIILAAHVAGIIRGVKQVQNSMGDLANRRISSLDDFEIHYVGMLGEIAVCNVLGIEPRCDVTRYGDGFIDIEHGGRSWQIKTSTHASLRQKRLVFLNSISEFKTDYLISCSLRCAATVAIHGFISKRKFEAKMFAHDFGYGNRVCVSEDELTAMSRINEAMSFAAAR